MASRSDWTPDERFMRDFFRMPQAEVTFSSKRPSGEEVRAYCKKNIGMIVVEGQLLLGVRDDFTNDFLPITKIPGSLTAEHIRDKRPVKWWHVIRRWKRRGLRP